MSGKDYYDILGIKETATSDEVRDAFRNLAHKHHPDKGGDAEMFKKISEAYQVLGDSFKRRTYDQSRQDKNGDNINSQTPPKPPASQKNTTGFTGNGRHWSYAKIIIGLLTIILVGTHLVSGRLPIAHYSFAGLLGTILGTMIYIVPAILLVQSGKRLLRSPVKDSVAKNESPGIISVIICTIGILLSISSFFGTPDAEGPVAPEPPRDEPHIPVEPAPLPSTPWPTPVDSDSDGLSDVEEHLYGTDPNKADTNDDGVLDFDLFMSYYNPAGSNTLMAAGLIKEYAADDGSYRIFYPTSWTPFASDSYVIFTNPKDDATFFVQTIADTEGNSMLDWYMNTNPNVPSSELKQFSTDSGLTCVRGPEMNIAYCDGHNFIYRISYHFPILGKGDFLATFYMMVTSLKVRP